MAKHDTQQTTQGPLRLGSPTGDGSTKEPEALDLREYLAIFLRRRWLMLLALGLVITLGMLYTFAQRPIYEATTKILVNSSSKNGGGGTDSIAALNDLKALTQGRSVDTQVEIIASNDLLSQAFNSLPVEDRQRGFGSETWQPWITDISAKKNTDIIEINVHAYTPEDAAALSDRIARLYFDRDLEQSNQATRQVRKYVEENMGKVETDLTNANKALAQYKQSSGLIAPDTQLAKFAEMGATLQLNLESARADVAASQKALDVTRGQLGAEQENVVADSTVTQNPRFASVIDSMDKLHAKRAELLQEYTPKSPEVKAVDGQIDEAKAQLRSIAETIVSSETHARNPIRDELLKTFSTGLADQAAANARVQALQSEIASNRASSTVLPERERKLAELMQQASMLKQTYEMLTSKYHELVLGEQGALPNGRLVDHARVEKVPVSPKPLKNAVLFILLGAVAAIAVAVVAERLDDRVHNQETAEKVTLAATLAVVPKVQSGEPRLISQVERHSALLESFRILRNNIAFAGIDQTRRLLAVTSSGPGEGKSTVCANTAMAMALDGKRVLVVDCDLRRPSMHTLMGASRDIGFTTVVTGGCKLEEAIISTQVEGLSFLPTGPLPPNPTEVLNSQASRHLFETLLGQYDIVMVDCPPATGLADIQIISQIVDGLLLVVSVNQTLKTQLGLTVRTLAQAEAPLMGLVLNRLDLRHSGQGYYYYYYAEETGKKAKRKKQRKSA